MRTTVRKLVERLDKASKFPEPIYEFGSYQVKGQEDRAIRHLFKDRDFTGCDMREGPGVDRILNLENLEGVQDKSVGSIICLDTFEHVKKFWLATDEIYRVLKPGGVAVIVSVMYFPVHDHPSDYWRFTPEGFRVVAEKFEEVSIEDAGPKDFPHTVIALAHKGPTDKVLYNSWDTALGDWKRKDSSGWKEIALILLPPILIGPCYKLLNFLSRSE